MFRRCVRWPASTSAQGHGGSATTQTAGTFGQSLKTTNKRVAERKKQATIAKLLDPFFNVPNAEAPTTVEFWEGYLTWAREHKRSSAVERTEIFWKQLMQHTKAERISELSSESIESFKRWRKQKGNSEETINNGLRELKSVFNRCKKLKIYSGPNPVDEVDLYPVPWKAPEFLTLEQLELLLECAVNRGREVAWTVLLCGWAGLRKGEVANARWEWMDFDSRHPTIHVKAFDGFQLKDNEDRSIPMNQRIRDELFPLREQHGFIFPIVRCGPHHRYRIDLRSSLVAALKEAGLPTEKPYQRLRHSFGSILAQRGVSLFKVSKWMGHSTVLVTERHYAEASLELLKFEDGLLIAQIRR